MQKLQLSIPEPCHENWQQMTPTEKGRFCNACAKEVVDFSTMTDMQVLNYFTNLSHEKVCGRALPEQLDRTISRPETARKKWYWYWNYFVMFFIFFTKGNSTKAQGEIKPVTELSLAKNRNINQKIINEDDSRIISGKITDVNGNTVSYASIIIKGTNTGVAADANGIYSLTVKSNFVLFISAVLFKSVEVPVGNKTEINVVLENYQKTYFGDIVITSEVQPLNSGNHIAMLTVKDFENNEPINEAVIITTIAKGGKKTDTVLADRKGKYKISGIAAGDTCYIKVNADGYEPNEFTINLSDFKNRKKEWEVLLKKKQAIVRSTVIAGTGKQTVVRMGGIQHVTVNKAPLYVVDGVIVPKHTDINPGDVEDYSVLQAPAAVALFGADGANGAVIITTKRSKTRDLDTVTVTAYPLTGMLKKVTTKTATSMMGAMVKGYQITIQNPITDTLKTITTAITGAIKVIPNPVQRNSVFSVALKLNQPGNGYRLLISDAAGRILSERRFNTTVKAHTEKITADNQWASGVYFIRIFGPNNKLISKSSFVFQ